MKYYSFCHPPGLNFPDHPLLSHRVIPPRQRPLPYLVSLLLELKTLLECRSHSGTARAKEECMGNYNGRWSKLPAYRSGF